MKIKMLTSCAGVDFAYRTGQEVSDIDPVVGNDLVKHGLAELIEADADDATNTDLANETGGVEEGAEPSTATADTGQAETATGTTDPDSQTAATGETGSAPVETANVETKPGKPGKAKTN